MPRRPQLGGGDVILHQRFRAFRVEADGPEYIVAERRVGNCQSDRTTMQAHALVPLRFTTYLLPDRADRPSRHPAGGVEAHSEHNEFQRLRHIAPASRWISMRSTSRIDEHACDRERICESHGFDVNWNTC